MVAQKQIGMQTRRVIVIRDGDLYRWQLQRSPVQRTMSTSAFTTLERAIQAAHSVAAAYEASYDKATHERLVSNTLDAVRVAKLQPYVPFQQPSEAYADVMSAEDRADWIGD